MLTKKLICIVMERENSEDEKDEEEAKRREC